MPTTKVVLRVLPGMFAICRLAPESRIPAWATAAPFCSVTRTPEELSIVAPAEAVPAAVAGERGWRCLAVAGPLPLDAVGVLAAIAEPLTRAGISLFAVSTYDTDYVLVKEETLGRATSALSNAGYAIAS